MKKFIAAVFAGLCLQASAGIISADFRNEGDLPYCCSAGGPLVTETLGAAVGAGVEHNVATPTSNPSGWSGGIVFVDLDPITNVLTLDSQDTLDFETFVFYIRNISFSGNEAITGLSLLSNALVTPLLSPVLSFTQDSVTIRFDVGQGNSVFDFTGNNATFQLEVGPAQSVPAPAGLLLLAIGFVALSRKLKK